MSVKAFAIVLSLVAATGYGVGMDHARVETKYRVLHDTKTVTVTHTQKIPGPPPSDCFGMAATARDVMKAGAVYDEHTAELLDILSQIRYAAAEHSSTKANDIETRLRKLEPKTIDVARTLASSKTDLNKEYNNCTKGLEYASE